MTFLNPLYLLGITAGIIPFLIHLLYRRRLKVIEFSSLEFLKRIEGRKTRWFRIREMLLLILRCLAVVLLALAISRPVLKSTGFGSLSSHARASSVFILDNSYSMGRMEKGKSSFSRAKTIAEEILKLMDKGDDASLILVSDISRPVFENPVHDKHLLRGAIMDAALSARGTDFRPSLETAMAMLQSSRNLNREVYLFTDMQRSGFESFSRGGVQGSKGKRLYVFDSSARRGGYNIALENLVLADPLLFQGGRVEFIATLRNYSQRDVNVSLLSRLDGREMGVKEVSIPATSSRTVELAFSVEERGLHYLRAEIGKDDLTADNSRLISFKIPGEVKVALILDKPLAKRGYVETALSPQKGLSMFNPKTFSKGELSSINLKDYSVIALLGIKSVTSADVLRLTNFVQKGGGLVIALGPSADIHFYNSVLLPKLTSAKLRQGQPVTKDKTFFLRVTYSDNTHPIFSQFRDNDKGDLSIARVYNRLVCTGTSGVIARFSDGTPFIVVSKAGKGKVILSAIPFDGSFSDLPLKAIYVPLIHRIFRYPSLGEERDYNVNVGERLSLPISGLEGIICKPPDGRPVRIRPRIRSGRMYAEYEDTEEPGTYTMGISDSILAYFAVNPVSKESDVSRAEEDEVRALLAELRPKFLGRGEKPGSSIFDVRLGVELTNPLIILVLMVLIAEMFIAGRWRRTVAPEM